MILGGANCQLNAVKRARKMGLRVILVDYTPHPPAAPFADLHLQISTFDSNACCRAAKIHSIDGVMTVGTDQPVLTAAEVSAECGLPACITPETAFAVTNKMRMKTTMTAYGIPTAKYGFIHQNSTESELLNILDPYVLKPLDSQGQRGVFKLNTIQDVFNHLPETLRFSRSEHALVEGFYESDEITVSGWVTEKSLTILTVTDRLLLPADVHIGICIGHRYPSIHTDRYPEISAVCHQLVQAFRIENGPVYIQLLIGQDGIIVNELACRIGGAFEDFLIPYATGFDILAEMIHASLGEELTLPPLNLPIKAAGKFAAIQLMFCQSGKIAKITPLAEIKALPFILDVGYNYAAGDMLPAIQNATARFGHAVIIGNTKSQIRQNIQEFYKRMEVFGENGSNLLIRYYPEDQNESTEEKKTDEKKNAVDF